MLKSNESILNSKLLQKKLDEGCEIKPFPRCVHQLIAALKSPDSNSKMLAKIIESDVGLSARLLRMANSPLFGVNRELTSICHAVTMLGHRPLKNLAFTYACSTLFSGSSKTVAQRESIWNHSLGCAITARLIAESIPTVSTDDAFLAGLFHDIGKLLLLDVFPQEYGKLSESKWGTELLDLETELFGLSHDELGLKLVVSWPLRDAVKVAVRHHHNPELAVSDTELTRIICVANTLARSAGIGSNSSPEASPVESAREYLGFEEQKLWSIQETAFNVFIETKNRFAN